MSNSWSSLENQRTAAENSDSFSTAPLNRLPNNSDVDSGSLTPLSASVQPARRRNPLCSVPAVWSGWVVARLILGYLIYLNPAPLGDVHYYHIGVFGDDPKAMTEYPDAGTWPSTILAHLLGEQVEPFLIAFPLTILCFDALFMALILRRHPQTQSAIEAAWLWVLFGTAVGPVFLLRLDLFPALLVAGAAYFLFKHPAISAVLLALAAAMKLWPAVLAAALVGSCKRVRTWVVLLVFLVSVGILAGVTFFFHGVERLNSPLEYQKLRGLQIESVSATPLMIKRFQDPQTWEVAMAPSKSIEIAGPGVTDAISFANLCMVITLVCALAFAAYRFILGGWSAESALALFVVLIILLLVANKVFSPQYVTWLGPTLVVALSRGTLPPGQQKIVWALAVISTICGCLGTLVFPFGYEAIIKMPGTDGVAIMALALRNALVLVMVPLSFIWLVLSTRRPKQVVARHQLR